MTTTLAVPTVHLNGTPKARLMEQLKDARHAVSMALEALVEAAPNERDYYTQDPGAFKQAESEHLVRLGKLHDVHSELYEILLAVSVQGRT